MVRPAVDVVVPFAGSAEQLELLVARLRALRLGDADSLVVVDNNPRPCAVPAGGIAVLHCADRRTPGYARNRGAARGRAEWIVFLDADVAPRPDLLDLYFDPSPAERTALLGGGVIDEAVPEDARAVARYAYIRQLMSHENTYQWGKWSFAQTANAACRRTAFEAIGGFREGIRAGEDADLTYRLRAAGWEVEQREAAAVVHLNRRTVRGFVAQMAIHGAGVGWLGREYPGAIPPRRRLGLVWWGVRTAVAGLLSAVRSGDRDKALWSVFEPLGLIVFELGRSLPNERPLAVRQIAREAVSLG